MRLHATGFVLESACTQGKHQKSGGNCPADAAASFFFFAIYRPRNFSCLALRARSSEGLSAISRRSTGGDAPGRTRQNVSLPCRNAASMQPCCRSSPSTRRGCGTAYRTSRSFADTSRGAFTIKSKQRRVHVTAHLECLKMRSSPAWATNKARLLASVHQPA